MQYQPKRSTRRWLEGAPRALLAVYDNGGKTADRFTALYGAPLWDFETYGRDVPCRFMSENPFHPQGVGMFGDHPAHARQCLGKKVRFCDLPEPVKRCIRQDCEESTDAI